MVFVVRFARPDPIGSCCEHRSDNLRSLLSQSKERGMRVGTDLLIGDVFRNAAGAVPDRLAAVVGERSLTFAELDRGANRTARAVAVLGVAR